MKKIVLAAACFGLALLGDAHLASANVVQWNLSNVTFEDGDKVTGSFFFDADASGNSRLISWNISIPALNELPAYTFNSATEPANFQFFGNNIQFFSKVLLDVDPVGRTAITLQLNPASALTDAGGSVAVTGSEGCTYICSERDIVSGALVAAVPEPSSALALAFGIAAFAGFSTLRKPS
jgi:hypothetical protein